MDLKYSLFKNRKGFFPLLLILLALKKRDLRCGNEKELKSIRKPNIILFYIADLRKRG